MRDPSGHQLPIDGGGAQGDGVMGVDLGGDGAPPTVASAPRFVDEGPTEYMERPARAAKKRGRPKAVSLVALVKGDAANVHVEPAPDDLAAMAVASSSLVAATANAPVPFPLAIQRKRKTGEGHVDERRSAYMSGRASALGQAVVEAAALAKSGGERVDPDVEALGRNILGDLTLQLESRTVLSKRVEMGRDKVASAQKRFAAALLRLHAYKRAKLESVIAQSLRGSDCLAYIDASAHDETPLPVLLRAALEYPFPRRRGG